MRYKMILIITLLIHTYCIAISASENTVSIHTQYYLRVHKTTDTPPEHSDNETARPAEASILQSDIVNALEVSLNFDKVYNSSITAENHPEINHTDIVYCIALSEPDNDLQVTENNKVDSDRKISCEILWNLSDTKLLQKLLNRQVIELMIVLSDGRRYFSYELPVQENSIPVSRYNYCNVSNIGIQLTGRDGVNITSLCKQLRVSAKDVTVYALLSSDTSSELKNKISNYSKEEKLLAGFSSADCSLAISVLTPED